MGWRSPAGAASQWSSHSFGGLVVGGNGVRPGAFRQRVMLAPSPARTGRETAGALGRRVQVYGGNRRLPHVRRASDVAMVAGPLPEADPRRFKEMTQIYANIGLPRWEATRRAYTEVTARDQGGRGFEIAIRPR